MTYEKIKRLETISIKLEKVDKTSPVIADFKWLVDELRMAWLLIEATKTDNAIGFKDIGVS